MFKQDNQVGSGKSTVNRQTLGFQDLTSSHVEILLAPFKSDQNIMRHMYQRRNKLLLLIIIIIKLEQQ